MLFRFQICLCFASTASATLCTNKFDFLTSNDEVVLETDYIACDCTPVQPLL
jgi:hypothetical protein